MSQEPTPREMGYYLALAQTGVEMVVPAVLGFYLDQWLDTNPWIMCIAAALGFAGGLIHLIAILKQKERDESSDTKPPP
jgi:F0F1-type ATP synthase assembly protein I